ncbi:hypothetical protein D9M71_543290 [compost metagenome]
MQEGRGDAMGRCAKGGLQGVADELPGRLAGASALQGAGVTNTFTLQADEALDRRRAGANFAHGVQVQLEMAVMPLAQAIVGLFAEDDLVDQAGGVGVKRW